MIGSTEVYPVWKIYFLDIVIETVYLFVKGDINQNKTGSEGKSALNNLKNRWGEIIKDKFEEIKLRAATPP